MRCCFHWIAPALMLACGLAACSYGGGPAPAGNAAIQSQLTGAPPAELLAAIPFPTEAAGPKAAAADKHHQFPGNGDWLHGPGSYDVDVPFIAHRLPALPGELRWAIYRLPSDGFPVLETSVQTQVNKGAYYVGLANFTVGSWQFSSAQTEIVYSHAITEHHISPSGMFYVVVAAYDNADVYVRAVNYITDEPGWVTVTIDELAQVPNRVRLFPGDQNELPRVGVLTLGQLLYYHANSRTPDVLTTWNRATAISTSAYDLFAPLEVTFVDWKPAMVCYKSDDGFQLQYTYATADYPGDEDWVTLDIGGELIAPDPVIGLTSFNDTPRILYQDTGTNNLLLVGCDSAAPQQGDIYTSPMFANGSRPSLAVMNGSLVCSFFDRSDYSVSYGRALSASPTGTADWLTIRIAEGLSTNFSMMTRITNGAFTGGLDAPNIAYLAISSDNPHFLSSTKDEPTAADDWDWSQLEDVNQVATFRLGLTEVSGVPALLYYLSDVNKLQYAIATSHHPASDADWQITTLLTSENVGVIDLGCYQNVPAVVYFDLATSRLKYSYLD